MTYKGIKREDTCGLAFDSRRSHASKRNDNEASAATKCLHFGMVEPIGHARSAMTKEPSDAETRLHVSPHGGQLKKLKFRIYPRRTSHARSAMTRC